MPGINASTTGETAHLRIQTSFIGWPDFAEKGGACIPTGKPTNGYHGDSGLMLRRQNSLHTVYRHPPLIPPYRPTLWPPPAIRHSTTADPFHPTELSDTTRRDHRTLTHLCPRIRSFS